MMIKYNLNKIVKCMYEFFILMYWWTILTGDNYERFYKTTKMYTLIVWRYELISPRLTQHPEGDREYAPFLVICKKVLWLKVNKMKHLQEDQKDLKNSNTFGSSFYYLSYLNKSQKLKILSRLEILNFGILRFLWTWILPFVKFQIWCFYHSKFIKYEDVFILWNL